MARREPPGDSSPFGGLAPLGIAAFAVLCCAALPALAAVAASVTIGTLVGVGAGLAAAVLLGGLVAARVRQRRARDGSDAASGRQDAEESGRARPRDPAR